MSQHEAHQHRLTWVVDLADEPIGIAFDIENGTDARQVGVRKIAARICEILPLRFRSDFVPAAQRLFGIRVLLPKLPELFETDNVHNS